MSCETPSETSTSSTSLKNKGNSVEDKTGVELARCPSGATIARYRGVRLSGVRKSARSGRPDVYHMFVHSAEFVERHDKTVNDEISIYGVEKDRVRAIP